MLRFTLFSLQRDITFIVDCETRIFYICLCESLHFASHAVA